MVNRGGGIIDGVPNNIKSFKGTATALLRITLNAEKEASLVVIKGESCGRIPKNIAGLLALLKYVCQDKALVDLRDFKHWILEIRAAFASAKDF